MAPFGQRPHHPTSPRAAPLQWPCRRGVRVLSLDPGNGVSTAWAGTLRTKLLSFCAILLRGLPRPVRNRACRPRAVAPPCPLDSLAHEVGVGEKEGGIRSPGRALVEAPAWDPAQLQGCVSGAMPGGKTPSLGFMAPSIMPAPRPLTGPSLSRHPEGLRTLPAPCLSRPEDPP